MKVPHCVHCFFSLSLLFFFKIKEIGFRYISNNMDLTSLPGYRK